MISVTDTICSESRCGLAGGSPHAVQFPGAEVRNGADSVIWRVGPAAPLHGERDAPLRVDNRFET
jgi:hypothetical protein